MAKKVTVDWTDPSPTTNLDHQEVWRKTGAGGTYAKISGNIGIGVQTFEDTNAGGGLVEGETYFYQVRAYNPTGQYSNVEGNITISNSLSNQVVFSLDHNGANFINAVDSTVMTNNNIVTLASPIVTGSSDAGRFDGVNQYLSTPSTGDLATINDFTVACWVNMDNVSAQQVLCGQYLSTGNQRGWNLALGSVSQNYSPTLTVDALGDAADNKQVKTDIALTALTEYFIVAWHDSTADTINIQVNNGTVYSLAHTTGIHNSTGNLTIGAMDNPLLYADGDISMDLWHRVLTTQERTDLYNSGNGVKYPTYA